MIVDEEMKWDKQNILGAIYLFTYFAFVWYGCYILFVL